MQFIRKLLAYFGPISFTLAGAVIVMTTLSGTTQKAAIIATLSAVVVHFAHSWLNDSAGESTDKND